LFIQVIGFILSQSSPMKPSDEETTKAAELVVDFYKNTLKIDSNSHIKM